MGLFRNLFIGKQSIPSRVDYKYALLRSQFAIIMCAIALFYIGLDTYNGVTVFIPFYLLLGGVAIISIFLNRYKYFIAATVVQLMILNTMIFLFADVDHPYGGVFFYFMTCSVTALILLNNYHRAISIGFALLPILLGYIAYTYDFNLIPPPVYEDEMIRINFITNLTIGIISNAFVVYFLMARNTEVENSLRENERHLIKVSTDLKISEDRFVMALQGSKAGIYEWRVKTNSIYVSPYWKEILGYSNDELANLTFDTYLTFLHKEDAKKILFLVEEKFKTHAPYQIELQIRTKSGAYKWVQDSGISKQDEEGNTTIVIGSIIDIDERKKAENELAIKNFQLAKTNEELDRFVYSASHDMRAPLSSLLGLIHLSEKTDRPEEIGTLLQMMKDRIKTMEGFIKEVTDYSRNTRLDLALIQVSLFDLVSEVVHNLAYSIVNKKVRIDIAIDKKILLDTDVNRLKVVINNLLSNAYKYHQFDKHDPYIRIAANEKGQTIIMTIEDNGQGIAPEHHVRIFEMFYRASESSDGSGLGLYIVKETLDKLNGSISVTSTVGEGTEFIVTLPSKL